MNLKCEIVRDLIPLYIDGVCTEESKEAVEKHIEKCEECRKYYENMKETSDFYEAKGDDFEEEKMKESLKKVKSKISKKIRNTIVCAVSAMVFVTAGFWVLFNVPIKKVDKNDVKISAVVYPFSELSHSLKNDNESVEISLGEDDKSGVYRVEIPSSDGSQINVSEKTAEKDGFATQITTTSNYFLRSVNWEIKDDTIFISSFKTTFFGNKAKEHQKTMSSLEFREINKIVFVEDGKETVLWEREKEKNGKN